MTIINLPWHNHSAKLFQCVTSSHVCHRNHQPMAAGCTIPGLSVTRCGAVRSTHQQRQDLRHCRRRRPSRMRALASLFKLFPLPLSLCSLSWQRPLSWTRDRCFAASLPERARLRQIWLGRTCTRQTVVRSDRSVLEVTYTPSWLRARRRRWSV